VPSVGPCVGAGAFSGAMGTLDGFATVSLAVASQMADGKWQMGDGDGFAAVSLAAASRMAVGLWQTADGGSGVLMRADPPEAGASPRAPGGNRTSRSLSDWPVFGEAGDAGCGEASESGFWVQAPVGGGAWVASALAGREGSGGCQGVEEVVGLVSRARCPRHGGLAACRWAERVAPLRGVGRVGRLGSQPGWPRHVGSRARRGLGARGGGDCEQDWEED